VAGVVGAALERGVSLFDTAEVYGWGRSERLLGEALRAHGAGDEVVIASKVGGFRVARGLVARGVEAINRRLGRTVDVVQAHWPPPAWVPLCGVVRALEDAVLRGLAHHYGLSNYPAPLVERALECARRVEPVSDQVQYSLAYRSPENRLQPLLRSRGLALVAWSPLAKGALAGAGRPRDPAQRGDPVFREAARDPALQGALDRVSSRLGIPRATAALAWLVSRGAIPIPGTRRPGRVAEIALAGEVELPGWAVEELDAASRRYLERWGRCYGALRFMRLIPCWAQYLAIRLAGGV
ncbi:MAG: aldo/keto reductase, partial [Desulfurococcales archaeon]|nr:aldo/keto reductase [Desulfurococcales archaeon]